MKKTHFFRYLICGAMLLSGLSCSDDENGYDPNNVNDPEKLTEPCPTTDELEVTHANSLYYLSAWSEGVHTLSDNMVNRYQETVPYTSDVLDRMQTGDAFLFSSNDIAKMQSDAELLTAMKSMVDEKGIIMMMEGGTNEDFHTVCTLLDVFNPYGETSEEEADAQSDALPLWVFSGELPGSSGFFAKLVNPDNNNDMGLEGSEAAETVMDEHGQGVKCDMASLSLQEALEHKPLQSGSSNLTDLVNAYIVTWQDSFTLKQKGTDKPREGTGHYQLQAKIWNAYSIGQQRQFYLVNYGFICDAGHTFFGEWHDNRPDWLEDPYKCYGYCLTNVHLTLQPEKKEYQTILYEYAPQTTQNQSTYTSSVSFELGGEVSVEGPSISGGLTISNTHTETINDIEVIDGCVPSNQPIMIWDFKLKEPEGKFNAFSWASVDVVKGASAGISTFSLSTDFIISVSAQTEKPRFVASLDQQYTQFRFFDVFGAYRAERETENRGIKGKAITFPTVKLTE